MRKTVAGLRANVLTLLREPVVLGLLAALPLLTIELYSQAFGTFHAQMLDARVLIRGEGATAETLGYVTGGVFATATLAGILGLFQVIGARNVDRRLAICGFPTTALLGSRLVTVLGVTLLIADVTLVWLSLVTTVTAAALAFGALALAGVLYALIGVLVGSLLPRGLEGSLVLVLLADVDNVFAAGVVETESPLAKALPLHYPHELFQAAVLGTSFEPATVAVPVAYVAGLLLVTYFAYRRTIMEGAT